MIDKFIYGFIDRVYGAEDYTQQEINAKLIQKMDEVIENCNNAFEFVEWTKGEGLNEEVQNILYGMLENGELNNLFNISILNNLKIEIKNLQKEVNKLKEEVNKLKNEV